MERWTFTYQQNSPRGYATFVSQNGAEHTLFAVTVFEGDPVSWLRRISLLPTLEEALHELQQLIREEGNEALRAQSDRILKHLAETWWETKES